VLKGIASAPFASNDKRAPSSTSVSSSESAARAAAATAPDPRRDEAASSSTQLAARDEHSGRSSVANPAATEPSSRNGESDRIPAAQTTSSADAPHGASAGRASDRNAVTTVGTGSPNQLQTAPSELGGASGAVLSRGTSASAGGVRGGSTVGEHSDDPSHITGKARAISTPLATWNRAESALAHEPLPLELRNYVREYLIAIRPGSQP
jgi:hypothetical protein